MPIEPSPAALGPALPAPCVGWPLQESAIGRRVLLFTHGSTLDWSVRHTGVHFRVVCRCTETGSCDPHRDLLDVDVQIRANLEACLERLASRGQIRNADRYHRHGAAVICLTNGSYRLTCLMVRDDLLLIHAGDSDQKLCKGGGMAAWAADIAARYEPPRT